MWLASNSDGNSKFELKLKSALKLHVSYDFGVSMGFWSFLAFLFYPFLMWWLELISVWLDHVLQFGRIHLRSHFHQVFLWPPQHSLDRIMYLHRDRGHRMVYDCGLIVLSAVQHPAWTHPFLQIHSRRRHDLVTTTMMTLHHLWCSTMYDANARKRHKRNGFFKPICSNFIGLENVVHVQCVCFSINQRKNKNKKKIGLKNQWTNKFHAKCADDSLCHWKLVCVKNKQGVLKIIPSDVCSI